ncbi:MAG: nucleoside recognition protein, partial [Deltaproteobacteria bacterium]|nr:nucleoside recognition protein [Deltaproteobacteria bacterium]
YFAITLTATLLRTVAFLVFGHLHPVLRSISDMGHTQPGMGRTNKHAAGIWQGIRQKLPARIINIAVYVLPVYVLVFVLNSMGLFKLANQLLSQYVVTSIMPMESLSVVILSFAAEFTSGFAAAGALMDAGILTVKQTVLALLIGNVIAFPIRALRHQLPRYIGIFSPKTGTQLLLMGQSFRVISLIIVGYLYYYTG